jgi:hypothetical protein
MVAIRITQRFRSYFLRFYDRQKSAGILPLQRLNNMPPLEAIVTSSGFGHEFL